VLKFIEGKKTYLVAAASLIYAASGWYTQALSGAEALQIAQAAVMGAFIRHGVQTGA
jgi:hypothetical protein